MAVHVRYNSWYISLPYPAKQQREMTKLRSSCQTLCCLENVNHDSQAFKFLFRIYQRVLGSVW